MNHLPPNAAYGAPPQTHSAGCGDCQLSRTMTAIFGVASFVPLAAVVATATYLVQLGQGPFYDPPSLHDLIAPLVAIVGVAMVQIVLGIVVAALSSKRADLNGSQKVIWSLGCLFVGSLMLPAFWLLVLRKELPHYAPPQR